MGYTVEFIRKSAIEGLKAVPINLLLTVEINPRLGTDIFDVTITIKEPWTYGTLSNEFSIDHIPNGNDYGRMIVYMLTKAHPHLTLTWEYYPMDQRIIIKNVPERDYPWQELFKEKPWTTDILRTSIKEENKTMRFTKVIVNGPATIAWLTTGRINKRYAELAKKVVIKKADGDAYDLEKAMLLCWAKSWFSDDTDFHKWFRTNMKMFKEAYNEAHPDIDELDATLNGKVIADSINATLNGKVIADSINTTLDRMSQRIHEYSERINKRYAELAEKKEPMYGDDVVELFKATFNATEVQEPGAPWTWDEISFLHRHYSSKSTKSIAMALGRSEYAVRSKAKRLGIKKGGNTHG